MEEAKIVDFFQRNGFLIQQEAIEFILKKRIDPLDCLEKISNMKEKPLAISVDLLNELFKEIRKEQIEKREERKREIKEEEFKIIKELGEKTNCSGKVDDFLELFKDRFFKIREIIKRRQEMRGCLNIKRVKKRGEEDVSIIGIIRDIRQAKNGFILDIEDDEDSISVYVPKDVDSSIMNDEVIGINGKKNKDLFIAKNIVRPEIPIEGRKNFLDEEKYVLFISDLHVGSKNFLEKKWNHFVKWLNGENGTERQKEVARKIRYVIISGDLVEGIGIYPNQEKDLEIEDIFEQYKCLSEKLSQFPPYIKVILQPGNHDAVRPPLPQPPLEREIRQFFEGKNFIFVSNPCYLKIGNATILSYHGQSIQDFASVLPGLNQNNPTKIMREMLRRRHLAPIYGGLTSLAPEREDYLVVDIVPDIFVTGHVHVSCIESYRGVILVNASAWQKQTDYQRTMNLLPDPAKPVVVNLANFKGSIISF
ncbi:MAG: DNA-directed DNA polymerase II small subunit [Thermoplasmatales archaeon]|nr:DNA-directed DNA polymerase II small subunit [Thermoplasmatales archaeon]